MNVAIVDYGCGNLKSIVNILEHVGVNASVVSDPQELISCDSVILPGVGHFDHGMTNIEDRGFAPVLHGLAEQGVHILGICLGMQLMTSCSEEGNRKGLGWFNAKTKKFTNSDGLGNKVLVPHMGWNYIKEVGDDGLFDDGSKFYFVHSYFVDAAKSNESLAETKYGGKEFSCAIKKGNLIGVQFHPEKSHHFGMTFFRRYFENLAKAES